LVTQPIVKRLSWGGPPGSPSRAKAIACRLKALTVQEPMHGILLGGNLIVAPLIGAVLERGVLRSREFAGTRISGPLASHWTRWPATELRRRLASR
jgi:hypothetical protein